MSGVSPGPTSSPCRSGWRRVVAALGVAAWPLMLDAPAFAQAAPPIERVAALPSLTGTTPSSPVWAPDGSRLAFLWNDQALPFRDVWVVAADGSAPTRLTTLDPTAATLAPLGDDLSLAALTSRAASRARGGVSELLWSPDGESVVFVYRGRIHIVPAGGGAPATLAPSTGASRVAYSPDGRFLSFLQDGDLWLYRFEGAHLMRATHVGVPTIARVPVGSYPRPDVEMRDYAWSADSRYLALDYVDRRNVRRVTIPSYLHDEPILQEIRRPYPGDSDEIRRLGLYTVADGLVRFLDLDEPTNRNTLDFAWSPVAAELLIHQDSDEGEHRWLFVADAASLSVRQVWHDHRPRRIYPFFTALWSSDGKAIHYVGDTDRHYRLYSIPAAGGRPVVLTTGDFDVAGSRSTARVSVSPKTREIFYVSAEHSPYERHVYRMPEGGGRAVKVTSMPGVHDPVVSPDGRRVALVSSNDATPAELYLVDAMGGAAERRITTSPPAEFATYRWARPRYVTFKSRIDDFTLHARIIEPPNLDPTRKYPVVIGSVYSNTVRNEWRGASATLQQHLVLAGEYINVQVDLRGSVGYGVDFREVFQGDWGGGDLDDLHSTVDYLKTLPYVDPDRIGIWGSSYGGMMVLFALFERPGMFAAGVSGAPAIAVSHFTAFDQHLSRRPHTHPDTFLKSTLLNYGEKLRDPLLFIHGLHDDIVPFKTTVQMMEKLMLLGKDFDVAVAPNSAHGWTQREHYAVFLQRKLVQHFDRHLGRGARPAQGAR